MFPKTRDCRKFRGEQDHRNPTVDALAAWRSDLEVTFSSGRLADDVATILGATHVALAYGTFTWMLTLLGDAQVLESVVSHVTTSYSWT